MENTANENMTVDEMKDYLRIGICSAYKLLKEPGFPVVKICKGKFIIPKAKLDKWLEERAGKED